MFSFLVFHFLNENILEIANKTYEGKGIDFGTGTSKEKIIITKTVFDTCISTGNGGAIYLFDIAVSDLIFTKSHLVHCSAVEGGSVSVEQIVDIRAVFDSLCFVDSVCSRHGQAIRWISSTIFPWELKNILLQQCGNRESGKDVFSFSKRFQIIISSCNSTLHDMAEELAAFDTSGSETLPDDQLSYSSVINTSSKCYPLFFAGNPPTQVHVKKLNIIRNHVLAGGIIFQLGYQVNFRSAIILQNTIHGNLIPNDQLIVQQNVEASMLIFSNCVIENFDELSQSLSLQGHFEQIIDSSDQSFEIAHNAIQFSGEKTCVPVATLGFTTLKEKNKTIHGKMKKMLLMSIIFQD